jgi:ribosomal protein S21
LKKTGKKEGMLWLWQEGEFYKGLSKQPKDKKKRCKAKSLTTIKT